MHSIIIIHVGLPECNNLDNVRMSPQHTIKAGINCGYLILANLANGHLFAKIFTH